jgi:hypothetical protein
MFARLQQGSIRLGLALQSAVVRVLLVVAYVLGMGLTRLSAMVIARQHLGMYRNHPDRSSFWIDAKGYAPDTEALKRQF